MPELPEVEACRYHLEKCCLHSTILSVHLHEQGGGPRQGLFDDIIFDTEKGRLSSQSYIDSLLHRKVSGFHRKGKQIWIVFDQTMDKKIKNEKKKYDAVLFHFGMTGSIVIKDHFFPVYKSFDVEQKQWPPRFTKLELIFENHEKEHIHVSFADPRRLGKICLRDNPLQCPPISSLGIDLTKEPKPSAMELMPLFKSCSRSIKVTILDQEKIFCGVGNWIADEVLYQTAIHPEVKCSDLSFETIQLLIDKLYEIFHNAIRCLKEDQSYPDDWLFNYRWEKRNKNNIEGGLRMPNGNPIEFIDVGGRTSAIVPVIQGRTAAANIRAKSSTSATVTTHETTNDDSVIVSKKKEKVEKKNTKRNISEAVMETVEKSSKSRKMKK